MPWMGFEPTIPEFQRVKTVHVRVLDRAATVIGTKLLPENWKAVTWKNTLDGDEVMAYTCR
jgi:hypothetical protein